MVKNLTTYEIYQFIISDFEGAWDSLAANSFRKTGRGNFMFGRQAMNLLEFAARLCKVDTTGNALNSLSSEQLKIEPKYFTKLPGPCEIPSMSDFTLPHDGDTSGRLLLWALFDLIRHGLAHQYQQTLVKLTDGRYFHVKLTGAEGGLNLAKVRSASRPPKHLAYTFDSDGDHQRTDLGGDILSKE